MSCFTGLLGVHSKPSGVFVEPLFNVESDDVHLPRNGNFDAICENLTGVIAKCIVLLAENCDALGIVWTQILSKTPFGKRQRKKKREREREREKEKERERVIATETSRDKEAS